MCCSAPWMNWSQGELSTCFKSGMCLSAFLDNDGVEHVLKFWLGVVEGHFLLLQLRKEIIQPQMSFQWRHLLYHFLVQHTSISFLIWWNSGGSFSVCMARVHEESLFVIAQECYELHKYKHSKDKSTRYPAACSPFLPSPAQPLSVYILRSSPTPWSSKREVKWVMPPTNVCTHKESTCSFALLPLLSSTDFLSVLLSSLGSLV